MSKKHKVPARVGIAWFIIILFFLGVFLEWAAQEGSDSRVVENRYLYLAVLAVVSILKGWLSARKERTRDNDNR